MGVFSCGMSDGSDMILCNMLFAVVLAADVDVDVVVAAINSGDSGCAGCLLVVVIVVATAIVGVVVFAVGP